VANRDVISFGRKPRHELSAFIVNCNGIVASWENMTESESTDGRRSAKANRAVFRLLCDSSENFCVLELCSAASAVLTVEKLRHTQVPEVCSSIARGNKEAVCSESSWVPFSQSLSSHR
jgi:hypothetical protein